MAGGKNSGKKVLIAERRQRVLELRKTGASFRQISDVIAKDPKFDQPKYSHVQAMLDCQGMLKEIAESNRSGAIELRELEAQRLDMAAVAIAKHVRDGHLGAIDRWLKIVDQRCKLYGLNLDDLNRAWATLESYGFERVDDGNGGYKLIDKYTQDADASSTTGEGETMGENSESNDTGENDG